MFRRPMTRLATAVTAAGAICALGASAAVAAPSASWSGPGGPVPGAFTNDTPAISSIYFPGPIGQGQIVGWRGRGTAGHVFYRFRTASYNKGHWSKTGQVPGESTSSAPSFRWDYGHNALLAVWTGHADHHIWYSEGTTTLKGTIDWGTPTDLPNSVALTNTIAGPATFFPYHKNVVIVAWRAPFNHVRFAIGTPKGAGFSWSNSTVVPGNPPSPTSAHCTVDPCTSATPAVAEVSTSTGSGTLYFAWKQLGTNDIFYSSFTDNASTNWSKLVWSGPTQVPGAASSTGPAASDTTLNGFGPLLLAYKGVAGTHVWYQTLTGTTWSAPAVVPKTFTAVSPALFLNVLATTTPTTVGNIILNHYV